MRIHRLLLLLVAAIAPLTAQTSSTQTPAPHDSRSQTPLIAATSSTDNAFELRPKGVQSGHIAPATITINPVIVAENTGPCYTIRSYAFTPTDPKTGVTKRAGYSTCQPATSSHLRDTSTVTATPQR
jgi:hypothetical protein